MINDQSNNILYLNKAEVIKICNNLETVKIIEEVFRLHGSGKTTLPDEAYLSWINEENESARSLNMPCFIGGKYQVAGTKIINGNISNYKRGIERASALTILFDTLTAKPTCVMEGSYISALRTASVTALGIDLFKKIHWNKTIAIIGLGTIGKAHLDLLNKHLEGIDKIYIFDLNEKSIDQFIEKFSNIKNKIILAKDPKEAIINSDVIITTTTTDTGYIPYSWLRKGSLVIHVSLDDLLPDAISKADKLIVDDWNLVKNDNKRILGKMFNSDLLTGPEKHIDNKPYIHAELAEVVLNQKPGRENENEIIIFNPFGLSIDDISIASNVYKEAIKQNIGLFLER